ncbi:UNVERIFIED_CONTAM: hypothetical protein FKN15_004064 [Acipenser sinensis]
MESIQGLSSWCIENKKHSAVVVRHWIRSLKRAREWYSFFAMVEYWESSEGMVPLPSLVSERLALFMQLQSQRLARLEERAQRDSKPIRVSLPDGRELDAQAWKTSPLDLAARLGRSLADGAVVARVNGVLWDLGRPLEQDGTLEIMGFDSSEGKRSSSAQWRGDPSLQPLHRVIGVSFPESRLLRDWEREREEARGRDHRRIGRGAHLYNTLTDFIKVRVSLQPVTVYLQGWESDSRSTAV